MKHDNILLDTCALLWLVKGDKRISQSIKLMIAQADNVFISAVTGFEISLKYAKKNKLDLPLPPTLWLEQVIDFYHLSVLSLDLEICTQSALLEFHHYDPCDRFIIATAIKHQLPVITGDTIFADYPILVIKI